MDLPITRQRDRPARHMDIHRPRRILGERDRAPLDRCLVHERLIEEDFFLNPRAKVGLAPGAIQRPPA